MAIDPNTLITRTDGSTIAYGKLSPRDQLAHEYLCEFLPAALTLRDRLKAFKLAAVGELMAHRKMMMDDFGVAVGGEGGNITIRSADGRSMVKFTVQKAVSFGPELEAAKALIFECLNDWASSAGDELREIVTGVFSLNSKGRIDTQGILNLRKMNITDERWLRAMDAIDEAIRRDSSASYINFFEVDLETGSENRIPLDIAKL